MRAARTLRQSATCTDGVSEQELTSTGGDITSIGALLEGRVGRVSLQQRETDIGEVVNTHEPGAIKPVEQ